MVSKKKTKQMILDGAFLDAYHLINFFKSNIIIAYVRYYQNDSHAKHYLLYKIVPYNPETIELEGNLKICCIIFHFYTILLFCSNFIFLINNRPKDNQRKCTKYLKPYLLNYPS